MGSWQFAGENHPRENGGWDRIRFACVRACGAEPVITAEALVKKVAESGEVVTVPGVNKSDLARAQARGDVDAREVRHLRARTLAVRVTVA